MKIQLFCLFLLTLHFVPSHAMWEWWSQLTTFVTNTTGHVRWFIDSTSNVLELATSQISAYDTGGMCEVYQCPEGTNMRYVTNTSHILETNGCGSYGLSFPSVLLPGFASCCDAHDSCYNKCGILRSYCDREFRTCLANICVTVRFIIGKGETLESCKTISRLLANGAESLGCPTFRKSQADVCYCEPIQGANSTAELPQE